MHLSICGCTTIIAVGPMDRQQVGTRIRFRFARIYLETLTTVVASTGSLEEAVKWMLVYPLGEKQMALQSFGHLPWRSPFWVR